jgi:hypothetical protein
MRKALGSTAMAAVVAAILSAPASAQWLNYRSKKIPRTADGQPNLSAPAPKRADGKPDLSGIWKGNPKYMINITTDMKPDEVPFQPWAAAEYKRRRDTESKDDPSSRCLPLSIPLRNTITSPFKILDTGDEIVMLYEGQRARQIFLDDRSLPEDAEPSWDGYSVGKWEGDDLVVNSIGFNGKEWLDIWGHLTTDALHVIERYHRKDFGSMSLQITIDDPKAYTKPWTVTEQLHLLPDTELLEAVCENNQDPAHMVGK